MLEAKPACSKIHRSVRKALDILSCAVPSVDGGFGGPQPSNVEGRHVDYAAENAKRLAAGLGLGSVFDSLQSGSQRLKTSMGLPAQAEAPTFRSEPTEMPGFSRDTLFPPAGIRSTEIPKSPSAAAPASQQPREGLSDEQRAAQNMHDAFAEATDTQAGKISGAFTAKKPIASGIAASQATTPAAPSGGPNVGVTDSSAGREVGPGSKQAQSGYGAQATQSASNPAASLRDFLGHSQGPQGSAYGQAPAQLPPDHFELKSHPLDQDYPATAGGPTATADSNEFEKPATQLGMPAFGGTEASESQSAYPANNDALITLSHGIGQSPIGGVETEPQGGVLLSALLLFLKLNKFLVRSRHATPTDVL